MKLISVLTPTHNRSETFLLECINSVANQLEKGFTHEHIIIDNKSTDGTRKIVQALAKKDKRIKYVYNPRNLGAADALNVGLKKSKGSLIVPLDDDDVLPHQSLQWRFNFFQKNPKAKWTYGRILFINHLSQPLDKLPEIDTTPLKIKNVVHSLLLKNFILSGTVTIKKECLVKIGGWNPKIKTQDYDISLRLAATGFVPKKINKHLSFYRKHPLQSHKKQIRDGIYASERALYLNQHQVTEAFLKKLNQENKYKLQSR
jgi:alpha-1,6-rhamnosyltransferase